MPNFMDDKYRQRGKVQDFVSDLIDEQCFSKDENGNRSLDVDLMFTLAENNGISVENMEKHRNAANGVGRIRMTLANMLRARAKRRHGLYDVGGNVVDAPAEFVGDTVQTETLDGERITKKQPEGADEDAADAA